MLRNQLIASLLPISILVLDLLAVKLVFLQKVYAGFLVKINQMVSYIDNILVVTIFQAPHVHHPTHLDFQILDIILNIGFNFSATFVV